jgi:hypothetical protein
MVGSPDSSVPSLRPITHKVTCAVCGLQLFRERDYQQKKPQFVITRMSNQFPYFRRAIGQIIGCVLHTYMQHNLTYIAYPIIC